MTYVQPVNYRLALMNRNYKAPQCIMGFSASQVNFLSDVNVGVVSGLFYGAVSIRTLSRAVYALHNHRCKNLKSYIVS